MDSVEGALWLTSQTLKKTLGKNGVLVYVRDKSRNHPRHFFCGVNFFNYLTVLVYSKTTIHLGDSGGYLTRRFAARLYQPLATDTELNSTFAGLYIRAGSRRTSPASLPGFAGYFHCFTSQDMSRRWCLSGLNYLGSINKILQCLSFLKNI